MAYLLSQAVDFALNEPGQWIGVVHPTAPRGMPDNRMEWHTWHFRSLQDLQDWYDDWLGTPALYHFLAMFDKNDPTWGRGQALRSAEPGKMIAAAENRPWWEAASGVGVQPVGNHPVLTLEAYSNGNVSAESLEPDGHVAFAGNGYHQDLFVDLAKRLGLSPATGPIDLGRAFVALSDAHVHMRSAPVPVDPGRPMLRVTSYGDGTVSVEFYDGAGNVIGSGSGYHADLMNELAHLLGMTTDNAPRDIGRALNDFGQAHMQRVAPAASSGRAFVGRGGGGGVRMSRRHFGGTGWNADVQIVPTPVAPPPADTGAVPDPKSDPDFVNQSGTDPSTGAAVVAGHRVLGRGARFVPGRGHFDAYGREFVLEDVTPLPERLVALAPLLSPGANGLTVNVSFDGQRVHARICIDGRCYAGSTDLATAIAFLNAETAGDFALAPDEIDGAVQAAGEVLVGALIEDHVHSVCGSWWSDLKHTIFHAQHAVAKTIQKFKVPITMASTAVATYYGGASAGQAASKLTGPIIDASAGDSAAKKQLAQQAVAAAQKEAQTNPQTAKALAAAQTAVAQTTAAYHTVQTVANAAQGNPDAQKQLAELQNAADNGDVQAQKLLGVASDATDAANANAGDSTTIDTGPDPAIEMDSDAPDASSSGWGLLPYAALGVGAGLAYRHHRRRELALPAPIVSGCDYIVVGGFWHDIGGAVHGVGHAAFKVHHFVATTIQKFKAPIVIVAGIVASYYGGPLAGMAATAITGPAIDAMANVGEGKKKQTPAQIAAAKQLAALQKSNPAAAAKAVADAKSAIAKTVQAYHTVEVVKAAAHGDPAAKAQLAQMTSAASSGDTTAKDLLAIAQKIGGGSPPPSVTMSQPTPSDPSYVDPNDIEMDGNPDGGNPAPDGNDTAAMADAVASGTSEAAYREIAARTAATLHAQGARVVGVAVGAPGSPLAQTTATFPNSDAADDWYGSIAQEPTAYGYVAYYDAADPSWPSPLNESYGHITEGVHVSGLLPLVLTGLGAGVAAAYFWPTVGPKVKALFQHHGAA